MLQAIIKAAMEAEALDAAAAAQAGLPAPDQRFTLGLYVYTVRRQEPQAKDPGAP